MNKELTTNYYFIHNHSLLKLLVSLSLNTVAIYLSVKLIFIKIDFVTMVNQFPIKRCKRISLPDLEIVITVRNDEFSNFI